MDGNNNVFTTSPRSRRMVKAKKCFGSPCCESEAPVARAVETRTSMAPLDQNEAMESMNKKSKSGVHEVKPDYLIGDLVWAKIPGHSWWPAMVSYDPYKALYFEAVNNKYKNGVLRYHVQFFGEKVHRGWVCSRAMLKYEDEGTSSKGQLNNRREGRKSFVKKLELDGAIKMAEEAKSLSRQERRLTYTCKFDSGNSPGKDKSLHVHKQNHSYNKGEIPCKKLDVNSSPIKSLNNKPIQPYRKELLFPPLNCSTAILSEATNLSASDNGIVASKSELTEAVVLSEKLNGVSNLYKNFEQLEEKLVGGLNGEVSSTGKAKEESFDGSKLAEELIGLNSFENSTGSKSSENKAKNTTPASLGTFKRKSVKGHVPDSIRVKLKIIAMGRKRKENGQFAPEGPVPKKLKRSFSLKKGRLLKKVNARKKDSDKKDKTKTKISRLKKEKQVERLKLIKKKKSVKQGNESSKTKARLSVKGVNAVDIKSKQKVKTSVSKHGDKRKGESQKKDSVKMIAKRKLVGKRKDVTKSTKKAKVTSHEQKKQNLLKAVGKRKNSSGALPVKSAKTAKSASTIKRLAGHLKEAKGKRKADKQLSDLPHTESEVPNPNVVPNKKLKHKKKSSSIKETKQAVELLCVTSSNKVPGPGITESQGMSSHLVQGTKEPQFDGDKDDRKGVSSKKAKKDLPSCQSNKKKETKESMSNMEIDCANFEGTKEPQFDDDKDDGKGVSSKKSKKDLPSCRSHKKKETKESMSNMEVDCVNFDDANNKSKKQYLCSLCEEPGDLVFCHGTCCNAFHADCLGFESSADIGKSFKCDECTTGSHSCFACGHGGVVQRCNHNNCGKYYHPECMSGFKREGNKVYCPLHDCDYCKNNRGSQYNSNRRLIRCVRCPTAYHSSCLVAGCQQKSNYFMICEKHFKPNKAKAHHKHINVAWCFVCSKGGTLICCEICPAAFHVECIEEVGDVLEDNWKCDACKEGKKPLYGDIVWVKFGIYRWWPSRICFPNEIPQIIENIDHQPGEFPVQFYGTNDYQWLNIGRTFMFEEGDTGGRTVTNKRMDSVFRQGLKEATDAFRIRQEAKYMKALQREWKKPPSYGHIKVNKYVTGARSVIDPADIPVCECKYNDENPCGPDAECLNRILQIECNPKKCLAKEKCQNQRFQKNLYVANVPVRTKERGWGLRANQDVQKGVFVIEYQGEVIDDATCKQRIVTYHEEGIDDYYFLVIDKDLIIDAYPKGNASRFINHSCDPNCETQKWTVNGEVRVGLFANRVISKGEELTFNYNLDCLGNDKKQCKCGSSNCSGFIGERPRNVKAKSDKGKEPKKNKKKHKKSKKSIKKDEVAIHDDVCFTCKDGGDLILCDNVTCMKCYHLTCLSLEKTPRGKWECPWHFCDVCGLRSKVFCCLCPNSSCLKHSEETLQRLENGLFVCDEHDEVEVACAFEAQSTKTGEGSSKDSEPMNSDSQDESHTGLKQEDVKDSSSSANVEMSTTEDLQDRCRTKRPAGIGPMAVGPENMELQLQHEREKEGLMEGGPVSMEWENVESKLKKCENMTDCEGKEDSGCSVTSESASMINGQ